MKTIALTILSCSSLLFAQAAPQATKNEFPIVIKGVNCVVKAYKPVEPITFDPLVSKDSLPKSQMIRSIMLTKSDISSYMDDEELSKYFNSVLVNEEEKQAEREKLRAGMKKMCASTAPGAEDNPWNGMKYAIDQVFVVEAGLDKFLVYQTSILDKNNGQGKLFGFGTKNFVNGLWLMGRDRDKKAEDFAVSMTQLVPKEFEKLQKESAVAALPLEDLLR